MKTIPLAAVALLLAACNAPLAESTSSVVDPHVDAGMGGGGGAAIICSECPEFPSTCIVSGCIADSCIVSPAILGTPCAVDGVDTVCDGKGQCGLTPCDSPADCVTPELSSVVTCTSVGVVANVCASTPSAGAECAPPCAPVLRGSAHDVCAPAGKLGFYCPREGGPSYVGYVCAQPAAEAHPETWCCAPAAK